MSTGALPVARKRSTSDGGGSEKPRRKSKDPEPRQTLFSVKGRMSWLEWIDRLASFDRSTRAELLDRALARYAKDIGFAEQPPER
jgi:hypothetical protein